MQRYHGWKNLSSPCLLAKKLDEEGYTVMLKGEPVYFRILLYCHYGDVFEMKISQDVLGVTRDFKFFRREKVKMVHMKFDTSANRPAKLTTFCQKPSFFEKIQLKTSVHKVAGNAIGHKKNFPTCSLSPGETF